MVFQGGDEIMETPFKLLVYGITALALIAVISVFIFGQCFLFCSDPNDEIKELLDFAEIKTGKFSEKELLFPSEFVTKAEIFDSESRSVIFECNDLTVCCPKDNTQECSKQVEWNERTFSVKSEKRLPVFSRCRFEELAICKVFIGKEPAQLDFEMFFPETLNLSSSQTLNGTITVSNSGKERILVVDIVSKIFSLSFDEGFAKKNLFSESKTTLFPQTENTVIALEPNQSHSRDLALKVGSAGSYLAQITVVERNDLTNFEMGSAEFDVTGVFSGNECEAVENSKKFSRIENEQCFISYDCSGCLLTSDCINAWNKKGVNVSSQHGDNEKVFEIVSQTDSFCS